MRMVQHFPAEWLTEVVVLRGGGRDREGNPLPVEEIPLADCLVGSRSTENPVDRADLTRTEGILYRDLGFNFRHTDRIRIPDGTWLAAGEWAVDGDPKRWPMGWEVPLRKEP